MWGMGVGAVGSWRERSFHTRILPCVLGCGMAKTATWHFGCSIPEQTEPVQLQTCSRVFTREAVLGSGVVLTPDRWVGLLRLCPRSSESATWVESHRLSELSLCVWEAQTGSAGASGPTSWGIACPSERGSLSGSVRSPAPPTPPCSLLPRHPPAPTLDRGGVHPAPVCEGRRSLRELVRLPEVSPNPARTGFPGCRPGRGRAELRSPPAPSVLHDPQTRASGPRSARVFVSASAPAVLDRSSSSQSGRGCSWKTRQRALRGAVPEGPAGRQLLQMGPSAGSQRAREVLAECGPVGELSQGGRWELGAPSDATTWDHLRADTF